MPRRVPVVLALIVCGLIGSAPSPSPAADFPEGMERVTSVEGIDEFRLANGLRVLLFPDPSKQTTTVNVTYLVGSRHEGYGETGMAHLLEHLVFKGSSRHEDIPAELTAHGCRPNGSTWYDRTNYFETFAATEENLAWALDLEADRMVNSFIAKEDLDSEMTVVRNEFEMGENNPQSILEERVMSTAYLWHNYGKSTIGSRADIENVPIERLQAFYRNWYQPDNAVLVVAGKFDEARTLQLIGDTFGKIPRPTRELPVTYTTEPAQDGERTINLRRVGETQVVSAAYHIPAGSHLDFPAVEVLAFILGDTPSGRLHAALIESKKAATVRGWAYQLSDPGILYLTAEVRLDSPIEEARDAMIRAIDKLTENGPIEQEVERAREHLLKRWEMTLRNSSRAAIRLSEWSAMGDWRLMFLHRDRLRDVTLEDVRRVAENYLKPTNRTVGVYIPTKEPARAEIPATPDVAELLAGYAGGEALAVGEEFDPDPDKIETQVIRSVLPNGMKLVLLPKKTRGEIVRMALSLHLGDEKGLRGLARIGDLTGSMLMRGTTLRTRQEIQDEIDRLKAQVWVSGSATEANGGFEASSGNSLAALRLVAEILRSPAFPDEELERLGQEEILRLEESKNDPSRMAHTAFQRHMNPWPREDVRYVSTPEERILETEGVVREQLVRFHEEFYGASYGELCVIGDFDSDEVMALAEELFGGWKTGRAYVRLDSPYQKRPVVNRSLEAPDKESAVFMAGLRMKLRDDDPDYPALLLANFMTGGGFLNSRLATRIRQKEGLSYGVRSNFSASAWEEDAWFTGRAICAPQNVEKLETAFREEMEKIVKKGFTVEEVEAAKSGWLQSTQVSRSQDNELVRHLTQREHQNRTLAWDAELERRIADLKPEEILAAVRRYIEPSKMSVVKVGDFARVADDKTEARGAQ